MRVGRVLFLDEDGQETAAVPTVQRTETALERTRGLLNQPELDAEHGLWISPCIAVHSVGMQYPVDIIYLDRSNIVRKIIEHLKPLRVSACWHARSVLELAAGSAQRLHLIPGLRAHWTDDV